MLWELLIASQQGLIIEHYCRACGAGAGWLVATTGTRFLLVVVTGWNVMACEIEEAKVMGSCNNLIRIIFIFFLTPTYVCF